jgi:DNA-dependent protein kinase catalytic subunit
MHAGLLSASHINISVFLGRLIANAPKVFEPFASALWRSIVRLISKGDEYGTGINQFVHDLCLVVLTWDKERIQPDTSPESKDMKLLGGMFRYLAKSSAGKNRIFNQQIIRLLVERFASAFYPPTDVITEVISTSGTDQQSDLLRSSGLMFTSIVICNGMDPFVERESKISRKAFISKLVRMSEGNQTKSSRLAAGSFYLFKLKILEVVGQLLNLYKDKDVSLERELMTEVTALLIKLHVSTNALQSVTETFIKIINRISLTYPPIVNVFAKELLYIFPKLKDKGMEMIVFNMLGKASVLESLSSSIEEIPDLFTELRGRGLLNLIRHQEANIQTFTLLVLSNLAKQITTLSAGDVEYFLPSVVESFTAHPTERCRKAFYSLAYELSKMHVVKTSEPMTKLVATALVMGMNDNDEAIRLGISQLVNDDLLSKNILERCCELMSTFHLEQLESSFLGFSTFSILELTSDSPNYTMDLFDAPLPSARFDAVRHINTAWNSSMAPLFAPSQTQASIFDDDGDVAMRATASAKWTPTQNISQMQARSLYSSSQSEISSLSRSSDVKSLRHPLRAASRIPMKRDFAKEAERKSRRDQKTKFVQSEAKTKRVSLHRAYRVVCYNYA